MSVLPVIESAFKTARTVLDGFRPHYLRLSRPGEGEGTDADGQPVDGEPNAVFEGACFIAFNDPDDTERDRGGVVLSGDATVRVSYGEILSSESDVTGRAWFNGVARPVRMGEVAHADAATFAALTFTGPPVPEAAPNA